MMLSFLYWHLLHSSLSWGIKSQGNSTTGKKIGASEMTVEVGISLVVLDAILRNLKVSPYNREGAVISILLSVLLAPFGCWKAAGGAMLYVLDSGYVVYSNSLIPGHEMTKMTGFLGFDKIT